MLLYIFNGSDLLFGSYDILAFCGKCSFSYLICQFLQKKLFKGRKSSQKLANLCMVWIFIHSGGCRAVEQVAFCKWKILRNSRYQVGYIPFAWI